MSGLTSFFLFCSGVNKSILKRTPTDHNKYVSIGATIFFTGIFAAIAGGFALHTVFKSLLVSIPFGILWGFMIFNLDRYIVMSIKKKGNKWNEIGSAMPRLILAIFVALVISKPLELKLFESEIKAELVLMEQEKYKEQEAILKERYQTDITNLKNDIDLLDKQIESKRTKRDALNIAAIQEADGTGGSGQKNLGPIYKAKKRDADQAQSELDHTIAILSPQIEIKNSNLIALELLKKENLAAMDKTRLDGFAAQLDALGRLGGKSSSIFWASIFITFLFIAVETSPLFVKLVSDRSSYDYRLYKHEEEVALNDLNYIGKVKALSQSDLKFTVEMVRYENLETLQAEKEILKRALNTELNSVLQKPFSWKEYKSLGRKFH